MSNWIELNLPFYYFSDVALPEPPNVSEKERETFGFTLLELNEKFNSLSLGDYFFDQKSLVRSKLLEADANLDVDSDECRDKTNAQLLMLAKNDVKLQQAIDYFNHFKKRNDWYDNLLEISSWRDECDKIRHQNNEIQKNKSFSGLGLNVPGTLIEIDVDGTLNQYLIGDINVNRGVCDDCCMFDRNAIVKRYKVVWRKDVFNDNQGEAQAGEAGECCSLC